MDGSSVNGQIVDSVADVVTLNSGLAPTQAFGMLDTVMTETLGMAMYNAVSRQQGSSMIGSAATTAVCAKMLSTPFPFEVPAPPPAPAPTGGVQPLHAPPPKPPKPASVIIAAAKAEGESAIDTLKTEEQGLASDAAAARGALEQLTADAAPTVAAAVVAAAAAEAEASIRYLQSVANGPPSADQQAAQSQLEQLANAAGGPLPPPTKIQPLAAGTNAIETLQQVASSAPNPADAAEARATLDKLGAKAKFTPPTKKK
jgi:hypothetical protein